MAYSRPPQRGSFLEPCTNQSSGIVGAPLNHSLQKLAVRHVVVATLVLHLFLLVEATVKPTGAAAACPVFPLLAQVRSSRSRSLEEAQDSALLLEGTCCSSCCRFCEAGSSFHTTWPRAPILLPTIRLGIGPLQLGKAPCLRRPVSLHLPHSRARTPPGRIAAVHLRSTLWPSSRPVLLLDALPPRSTRRDPRVPRCTHCPADAW